VNIGSFDQITGGDIGVALTAAPSFGDQLIVADHAQVSTAGNLLSPSVTLGNKSQVGDVQTNVLHNDGATVLGAVAGYPVSLMPPPPVAGNPSTSATAVTIAPQQIAELTPGSYGPLTVGDNASVTLEPGTYSFSAATIGEHTQVFGDPAGVTVLVSGSLSVGGWVDVGPSGGATASKLVILVGGHDSAGGSTPAASIGIHSQVTALLSTPHGTLSIADHVQWTGALAGYDVQLSDHMLVSFQDGFSPTATPGQHGMQQLSGYVANTEMAAEPIVGALPPDFMVDFGIGLPVSDPQGLQNFIQSRYDPTSPFYRKYATGPSDFAARFGPSSGDYQQLQAFATSSGLTIEDTFPSNLLLHVSAPASLVESVFYTTFSLRLRPDGTQFYTADIEPSLDFSIPVLRVSGFDNYKVSIPSGGAGSGGSGANNGLGNNAGFFQGNDFRNAYLGTPTSPLSNLTGAAVNGGKPQHIALFEMDTFNQQDLNTYQMNAGLPTGTVVNQNQYTFPGASGACNSTEPNGQIEITGDVEVASAMAPGATIDIYGAPNCLGADSTNTIFLIMAACNEVSPSQCAGGVLPRQISVSWTVNADENTAQVVEEMVAQGQSLFVASGDFGSGPYSMSQVLPTPPGAPPSPVNELRFYSSVGATIVGGTVLNMTGAGSTYLSESTWNVGGGASGGGILDFQVSIDQTLFGPPTGMGSQLFSFPVSQPIPSYQSCVPNAPNGCSQSSRNVPDVSAVSDNIVVCTGARLSGTTKCAVRAGTSYSTPLWAGFTALINQQSEVTGAGYAGFLNPAMYEIASTAEYSTAFNDIEDFSNNGAFTAVPGYDLATGLGSPKWGLIWALVGGSTPPPPPPNGGTVTVGVSTSPMFFGDNVCVSAGPQSGWLSGYRITAAFQHLPGYGTNVVQGNSVATVNPDGSFSLKDTEVGQFETCTSTELQGMATIIVTETSPVTGAVVGGTTTMVPAELWCANGHTGTFGAGCQ
jgi:hypothetical protein